VVGGGRGRGDEEDEEGGDEEEEGQGSWTRKSSLSPRSTSRRRSAVVFDPGKGPNLAGSTPLEDLGGGGG